MNKMLLFRPKGLVILLCILIVTIAVLGGVIIYLLLGEGSPQILPPDEAYNDLDPDMQPYPDNGEHGTLTAPEGGGAAGVICEAQMTVALSKRTISLMFANPSRSQQNMLIELQVAGVTVAQSRRIEPGYCITNLPLINAEVLTRGIYHATLVVYFYDVNTQMQLVSSTLPITLTVQ